MSRTLACHQRKHEGRNHVLRSTHWGWQCMNKTGPRTQPCGTPQTSWTGDDLSIPRRTYWEHTEGKTETTLKLAHVVQRTAPADGTKYYGWQYRMQRIDQGGREQQRPRCPLPRGDRTKREKRLFLWSYSNGIQTAAMATDSTVASMR